MKTGSFEGVEDSSEAGTVMFRFKQSRSECTVGGLGSGCWMKTFVSLLNPLGGEKEEGLALVNLTV